MSDSQHNPTSPLLPDCGPTQEEYTTLKEMSAWFVARANFREEPLLTPYPNLNSAPIITQISYSLNARHLLSGFGILQYGSDSPIKFDNPKWRKMVGFIN